MLRKNIATEDKLSRETKQQVKKRVKEPNKRISPKTNTQKIEVMSKSIQ